MLIIHSTYFVNLLFLGDILYTLRDFKCIRNLGYFDSVWFGFLENQPLSVI